MDPDKDAINFPLKELIINIQFLLVKLQIVVKSNQYDKTEMIQLTQIPRVSVSFPTEIRFAANAAPIV